MIQFALFVFYGNALVFLSSQNDVKQSVAEFMSYVHTSVNEESQLYLANERRYNYTTPKSFLEQVCTITTFPLTLVRVGKNKSMSQRESKCLVQPTTPDTVSF